MSYPNGQILGMIAAVASSEFALFFSSEMAVKKSPPPPTTTVNGPACVTESVTVSSNRSSSEEDLSYDPHFDLDIDPESEDLDEVKEDVWASLLFFIGKPRDVKVGDDTQDADSPIEPEEGPARKADVKETKKGRKMKRRRGHFPKVITDRLKRWLFEHMDHPYPTEDEKAMVCTGFNLPHILKLAEDTGLTVKQINYWFTNSRRRFLKPKNE